MFDLVMGTWRGVLQWILTTWQTFEVFNGITIWNIILTTFISLGIVSVIIINFGGSSISKGVTDVRNSQRYNGKNDTNGG